MLLHLKKLFICRLISNVSASQVHHVHGGRPYLWTSCESCMYLNFWRRIAVFFSACHLDPVEQGFLRSISKRLQRSCECRTEPEGNENLEIVGPQHLATFLRTALMCSNIHFPMRWTYHVTELLPTGSPISHRAAPPHANEAPPTFISPAVDGTYSVLEDHNGVAVCAATSDKLSIILTEVFALLTR